MASGSSVAVAKKTSSTRSPKKVTPSPAKVTPSPTKVTPSPSKVSTRKSSKMQPEAAKVETPIKKKMAKSPVKEDGKQQQKEAKNVAESGSTVKSKRSTKKGDTKVVVDKSESGDCKFECEYCQKGFKRKYDMEKHARKHTGDKPYKCGICGNQVKKLLSRPLS